MDCEEKKEQTICGTVENVVFHSDTTDYSVVELSLGQGKNATLAIAVGTLPMAAEGEQLTLHGNWVYHPEYGRQFSFDGFEKRLPQQADGILRYLCSRTVRGVGPVTAKKMVDRFGADTFDVMENHPEWLTDVPGITRTKAAQISAAFREQTGLRGMMMFAGDYLATEQITRVYRRFGPGAVGIIRENPYILCDEVQGIPFERADALAESVGAARDSDERIYSGLRYVLSYNAQLNGHTCLPQDKLTEAGAQLLALPVQTVDECLSRLLTCSRLSVFVTETGRMVLTNESDAAERYIARKLYELDSFTDTYSSRDIAALVEKAQGESGITFADLQRRALCEALQGGVMILTGGPGTGKTTVVRAMLSIFESVGLKCVLAAPTGRAAKRLSEATSTEAKTIHRMLEMERTDELRARYNRNEKNPLEERVVIVDEASMIDLCLMEALLRALRRGARLVLIGDADQLPSVGAGNVLSDLLAAGKLRTVCLTEIFRQAAQSLIVTNAHRVQAGQMPVLTRTDADFFFIRREDERQIPDTVADLLTRRLPRAYGAQLCRTIQVVTPSRKGSGGVEVLNATLQQALNPAARNKRERVHHGVTFREGDRVMQNTNNYEIEWERAGVPGSGIFNGDIGVIEAIDSERQILRVCFDERVAVYEFALLDQLDLAYAITVHKSQGSEYAVLILPVYRTAPMLMTRNLLYTALTRARQMVVMVGNAEIVAKMVENNRQILRYTTLRERLCAPQEDV